MTDQMEQKAFVERLGPPPAPYVVRALAADHKYFLGQLQAMKVIFYFGGLVEQWKRNIQVQPEYENMLRWIESSVTLNPYCKDAYYLLQGVFTWDYNKVSDVNR
ncbi:MAG: hypothetical protein D6794_11800, partial [Deltaproteobacteria bacterium]